MNMFRKAVRLDTPMASAAALALIIGLGLSSCSRPSEQNASQPKAAEPKAAEANAVEANASPQNDAAAQNAKARLKAMSDYLAAQKAISLAYDSVFEVVTKDKQKLFSGDDGLLSTAG